MSEQTTGAYEQHLARLREMCPAHEGWEVAEIEDYYMTGQVTTAIPEFLKAKHPDLVEENLTAPAMHCEDRQPESAAGQAALPGMTGAAVREPQLVEHAWAGRLRFRWAGARIILVRVRLVTDDSRVERRSLVATTSRAALADLCRVVSAYLRARRVGGREITVVNGRNIPRPSDAWESLVLPDGMAEEIRRNAEAFFRAEPRYRELGLPYRRGFLLVGPPGNGKTQTIRVLAAQCAQAAVITLHLRADLEETELMTAFDMSRSSAPSILVLEDLDKLQRHGKVSLSNLLNLLDGLDAHQGVLVVASSNEPGKLDAALLNRPSRFDRVWDYPLPDGARRLRLLNQRGGRYFPEADLAEVARRTEGFSMAFVQEVVVNALLEAVLAGRAPEAGDLELSLTSMDRQFRSVAKGCASMRDVRRVGFGLAVHRSVLEKAPAGENGDGIHGNGEEAA